MQKSLGIIFIIIGVLGMSIYLSRGPVISTDEAIAMLLGLFMVLIGGIIIYSSRKKNGSAEGKDVKG